MPPKKGATKTAARSSATVKKATGATTTTKKTASDKKTPAARGRAATTTKKTTTKAATGAATKAAPTRKATTKATKTEASKAAPAALTKKRSAEAADEAEPIRTVKRARVVKPAVAPKPKPAPKPRAKTIINQAPTAKLNVYVCGEGSSGELGLGTAKNAIDVKRPRLNPHLSAETVGVVQVAVGGMHCVALTHDNQILTWGVNDQGALGRDTAWEGGYKDMNDNKGDSDSDSDSDDGPDLNPYEATPTAIPSEIFPEGTVFVEVAAGDSSSFALTDEGQVYGWGTFRVSFLFFFLETLQ
jgi:regulator of chromosome condensation